MNYYMTSNVSYAVVMHTAEKGDKK